MVSCTEIMMQGTNPTYQFGCMKLDGVFFSKEMG
jgi:hypothetical protein